MKKSNRNTGAGVVGVGLGVTTRGESEFSQAAEIRDSIRDYSSGQNWTEQDMERQNKVGFPSVLKFWLGGQELAAGPLLQAVQGQLDLRLASSVLHKLHGKMVAAGRKPEFQAGSLKKCPVLVPVPSEAAIYDLVKPWGVQLVTILDGCGCVEWAGWSGQVVSGPSPVRGAVKKVWANVEQAGGWSATFSDALGAGVLAIQLWRRERAISRDDTGADYTFHLPNNAFDGCDFGAAGVAWRAMVQSINSDCYGSSDAGQLAAADWSAWRQMVVVDGKRDLLAEWRIERIKRSQSPAARLAKVETMRDSLAAGRGRRAALADKVKHASLLLISGMESDKAAAAAGFKESASSRGHGKMRASDRLAAALTRAGRPVKTLRTMANDDFKAAARRGGAGVDLAALFSFAVPSLPFVPCPIVPVVVPACHPLDKATSGLPFGVEIGGESRKVLASPRLTLAVASRTLNARKLRGVVRPVFGRPARVAVRDAVLPVVHPVPVVATGSRRSPRGWQAPKVVVGSKVVVVGHGRLLQANEIYYLGLQWAGMVSL